MNSWKTIHIASLVAAVFLGPMGMVGAQEALPEVTEIFRVSNVGRSNVAETRELLMEIYGEVEKEYNVDIEKRRAALEEAYRGDQVRIIKVLDGSDANGQLYLCAYKGSPSVISIAGEPRKVGELTPALTIAEDGTHQTTITRTIKTKQAPTTGGPMLEEADSGVVSFFGIPLVFDDGPAQKRPSGKGKAKSKPAVEKKEVTEVKTLTKYKASVSTDKMEEGPALLSTALFVDLVKNGRVFQVNREENRLCQGCRGWGRVTDTLNLREKDGKMNCPECQAAGKKDWDVTYVVAW